MAIIKRRPTLVQIIFAVIVIILLVLLALWGVKKLRKANEPTPPPQTNQPAPTPEAPKTQLPSRTEARTFAPLPGWYNSKSIGFYDLGPAVGEIAPVYVLVTGFDEAGKPKKVASQNDIFDTKRGESGYTDFRLVKYVTVPTDYTANSLKSSAELLAKNWPVKDSGKIENRPQVLAEDKIVPDQTQQKGWSGGSEIRYWTFEEDVKSSDNKVPAGTIYAFVSGYDNGTPKFVQGQRNVFSTVPGQVDYTPYWRLMYIEVNSDYKGDTLKSVEDINKSSYTKKDSGFFINDPVVEVEGKIVLLSQPASSGGTVSKAPASSTAPQKPKPQTIKAPESPVIQIKKTAFVPELIQVPSGTTVIWLNNDIIPHTVTSDDGRFDSGALQPGQRFSMTFLSLNTIPYHCALHPELKASLQVVTINSSAGVMPVEPLYVYRPPVGLPQSAMPNPGLPNIINVAIGQRGFDPCVSKVPGITTVVWTNRDNITHSVTSDLGRFDSGPLLPGQSFTMTFTSSGSHPYHDGLNTTLRGTVVTP